MSNTISPKTILEEAAKEQSKSNQTSSDTTANTVSDSSAKIISTPDKKTPGVLDAGTLSDTNDRHRPLKKIPKEDTTPIDTSNIKMATVQKTSITNIHTMTSSTQSKPKIITTDEIKNSISNYNQTGIDTQKTQTLLTALEKAHPNKEELTESERKLLMTGFRNLVFHIMNYPTSTNLDMVYQFFLKHKNDIMKEDRGLMGIDILTSKEDRMKIEIFYGLFRKLTLNKRAPLTIGLLRSVFGESSNALVNWIVRLQEQ